MKRKNIKLNKIKDQNRTVIKEKNNIPKNI